MTELCLALETLTGVVRMGVVARRRVKKVKMVEGIVVVDWQGLSGRELIIEFFLAVLAVLES
jgi:hypothetical protein